MRVTVLSMEDAIMKNVSMTLTMDYNTMMTTTAAVQNPFDYKVIIIICLSSILMLITLAVCVKFLAYHKRRFYAQRESDGALGQTGEHELRGTQQQSGSTESPPPVFVSEGAVFQLPYSPQPCQASACTHFPLPYSQSKQESESICFPTPRGISEGTDFSVPYTPHPLQRSAGIDFSHPYRSSKSRDSSQGSRVSEDVEFQRGLATISEICEIEIGRRDDQSDYMSHDPRLRNRRDTLYWPNAEDRTQNRHESLPKTCNYRPPLEGGKDKIPTGHVSPLKLMKLVFGDPSTKTHDVFIFYHHDNIDWIRDILIPWLKEKLPKVKTEEDFPFCSSIIDEIMASINECTHLILALSNSFIRDPFLRFSSEAAYKCRPYAIILLALPQLNLEEVKNYRIYRELIRTNGLIPWSDQDAGIRKEFWKSLEARLGLNQLDDADPVEICERQGREPAEEAESKTVSMNLGTESTPIIENEKCVFVSYHDDDGDSVINTLISRLQSSFGKTVRTKENIGIGKFILEENLDSISNCEHLIFVLSKSFMDDKECCEFTVIAYALRPSALKPVVIPPLNTDDVRKSEVFSSICENSTLVTWSNESVKMREHFWTCVEEQLSGCS